MFDRRTIGLLLRTRADDTLQGAPVPLTWLGECPSAKTGDANSLSALMKQGVAEAIAKSSWLSKMWRIRHRVCPMMRLPY
jgi:hypothetical protein